jgi:hypothetical protein
MKTKWILLMVMLGIMGFNSVNAQTIIWVSDAHDTDTTVAGPDDQGWVDFLASLGFTVDYQKGATAGTGYWQTLDAAKLAALEAADMIIMSRDCSSGGYATDDAERAQWGGITKPLMMMSSYGARSANSRWFNNNDTPVARVSYYLLKASDPANSLFDNVLLDANNSVVFYRSDISPASHVSYIPITNAGNGRVLAARPDNGYVMIAEWDPGKPFYNATPNVMVGGPRMYFNAGTQEATTAGGRWGAYNLTPAGEQIFVNALEKYLGPINYNSIPQVNAGKDQTVILEDGSATAYLAATAKDDGDPYGVILYDWTMLSGPVQVTIENHLTAAPSVQFNTRGVYEFQVQVWDYDPNNVAHQPGKTAIDTVRVRVKDTAIDDVLVGHWEFEEGTGTVAANSASEIGDGVLGSVAGGQDPNWIGGWVGDNALEFYGNSFVQIPDANVGQLRWEITTAAWVKVDTFVNDWESIIGKWNTTWRLARRQNTNDVTLHLSGVQESLAGTANVNDGYWHHVAATYDGNKVTVYVDGQVNSSMEVSGPINEDLDPTHVVMIGNRGDNQTGRGWHGTIDDVYLYSYAITQDDVINLALLGQNLIPRINAGPDLQLVMTDSDSILIDAVGSDLNGDALTYQWTVVGPAAVEFLTGIDVEKPTVKFTQQGVYTFRGAVTDGKAGPEGDIFDEVVITVTSPTCQEAIEAGYFLETDINGDCHVNLEDFALMAADWVRCYDPQLPGCENPYKW